MRDVCITGVLLLIHLAAGLTEDSLTRCTVIQVVAIHSRVSLRCPDMLGGIRLDAAELKYQLYLNQTRLHSIRLQDDGLWNTDTVDSSGVQFHASEQNYTYTVTANCTALYTCKGILSEPPPHREESIDTFLFVEGQYCSPPLDYQINQTSLASQGCAQGSPLVPLWSLMLLCGTMSLYGLLVSGIAVHFWRRLKREELSQRDYINSKPGEFTMKRPLPFGQPRPLAQSHPRPRP